MTETEIVLDQSRLCCCLNATDVVLVVVSSFQSPPMLQVILHPLVPSSSATNTTLVSTLLSLSSLISQPNHTDDPGHTPIFGGGRHRGVLVDNRQIKLHLNECLGPSVRARKHL